MAQRCGFIYSIIYRTTFTSEKSNLSTHIAVKTALICHQYSLGTQSGSDEMEDQDGDELDDDSDETHQYGFLEDGMSPAFEACGKATASVGCPSPPFLSPLPV